MKATIHLLALVCFALLNGPAAVQPSKAVRAHYLITVADDFLVEVYHNGELVPHSKRQLLLDRFGATTERIDIAVREGDWLVFNVVNNAIRWGGASYFAVAGCLQPNEFGFVSDLRGGGWNACDTFSDVDRFITRKDYFMDRPAQEVNRPWQEGTELMHRYAGDSWSGTPLWGATRNTWIKFRVP